MFDDSLPFDAWAAEWVSYAGVPSISLAQKCLKMSQVLEQPALDVDSQMSAIREMALEGGRQGAHPVYADAWSHHAETLRLVLLDMVLESGYGHPLTVAIICREVLGYVGAAAVITTSPERPHLEAGRRALDVVHNRIVESGGMPLSEQYMLAHMLHMLGALYMRNPDHRKALRCIAMARGIGMEHPRHDRDVGVILHSRGDERAVWWLKKYLRENPDAHDIEQVVDLIATLK